MATLATGLEDDGVGMMSYAKMYVPEPTLLRLHGKSKKNSGAVTASAWQKSGLRAGTRQPHCWLADFLAGV
jgi:predicted esterase